MNKVVTTWTLADLQARFPVIHFPTYQRESSLWSLSEKQRLIDSILRGFDIAALYFYDHGDGTVDCVDGRQRINAIMSFLDCNPGDGDNGFPFRMMNEVYEEPADAHFQDLQGRGYPEIEAAATERSREFEDTITRYEVTVIMLSDSQRGEEFNLQFTRLNLGTIINSGEKLNAMVGELRDICYEKGGLKDSQFLSQVKIPTRRFAKEQVAAQIVQQIFALKERNSYTRGRHFDLQVLFKDGSILSNQRRETIRRLENMLSVLAKGFEGKPILKNRAITVSTVLLAWTLDVNTEKQAKRIAEFVDELLCRMAWQVKKGLNADEEYHYLLEFQRHITQASVEKPAIKGRAKAMQKQYQKWESGGQLEGDSKWSSKNGGEDPGKACRRVVSK